MKITYVAHVRIPTERAYGIQIMKTCEAFAHEGQAVTLVAPERSQRDPFKYYGVSTEAFAFFEVPNANFLRYGALGYMLSSVLFAFKTSSLPEIEQADIVYSRDYLTLLFYRFFRVRAPLVYEVHSKPSFLRTFIARRVKKVVAISKALQSDYVAAGVSRYQIVIASDAVDENFFEGISNKNALRKELCLPLKQEVVLYAGHLYPRKGAATLAAAARYLPNTLFAFVGGTRHDVTQFRAKWGGIENIRIEGHVAHPLVPKFLRAADVLVLPNSGLNTDSALYTSPMKLFEYMLSGVPIVASDVPALREVLGDESACFVKPDNPVALAEGIKKALSPHGVRCASKAHELAQLYTWNNRAKIILLSLRD